MSMVTCRLCKLLEERFPEQRLIRALMPFFLWPILCGHYCTYCSSRKSSRREQAATSGATSTATSGGVRAALKHLRTHSPANRKRRRIRTLEDDIELHRQIALGYQRRGNEEEGGSASAVSSKWYNNSLKYGIDDS